MLEGSRMVANQLSPTTLWIYKVRELLRFPLNLTEFSVYFGPFEVTQMRISQCLPLVEPSSFAPSLFALPLVRVRPLLHKL